jgi:hypothetical protein
LGSPEIDWLKYINENRKADFLETLNALSSLINRRDPTFILIGAFSLLLRRTLFRRSLWDIDLLFRDEGSLREFKAEAESTGARIVHYDDELVVQKGISSIHTAWRFQKAWVNVDYILRDPYYEFYAKGLSGKVPFSERVNHAGKEYDVTLYVAHPWDVFVDKMLSPRFKKELESKNFMGVDVRHVFLLLRRFGESPELWDYVRERLDGTVNQERFMLTLRDVLQVVPEIAIEGIGSTELAWNALSDLERRKDSAEGGSHA